MRYRNWKSSIAAFALVLSTLACIFEEEPTAVPLPSVIQPTQELPAVEFEAQPAAAAGECHNIYLPVVTDATWNYRLTGLFADTFTRRIINLQTNAFTDQDTFGSGIIRAGNWQCSAGNLTALDPASGTSASISSEGVWVEFRTTAQEGITLPASITPGITWSQRLTIEGKLAISAVQYDARNQLTNNCTAVGIEAVTVVAGAFNAMRVDCRTTMDITVNMPDKPNKNNLTLNVTNWYAENVGLIKTVTSGEGLDGTVELLSYTIP